MSNWLLGNTDRNWHPALVSKCGIWMELFSLFFFVGASVFFFFDDSSTRVFRPYPTKSVRIIESNTIMLT